MKNPKLEGSKVFDCIPQKGPCPNNCNQCFYNRSGAFFTDIQKPLFPTVKEVGDGIVRVNSGHDSNIDKQYVMESTKQYKHRFFNTSIPDLNFPGPVVFTANSKEEKKAYEPHKYYDHRRDINLMFVRLRVSPTNLLYISDAVNEWNKFKIPVVLTFMRYYDSPPTLSCLPAESSYEKRKHILNEYWCPTKYFMKYVRNKFRWHNLVSICGSYSSSLCKDCGNCWHWYWITKKRMDELA
jgi:hypothetical protein